MWGESFGHVFLEFHSKLQRLRALPDFGLCLCGIVNPPDRHIVRGESQGKVVRVMTFEAFMELHAVDFDRKQSDSVELTVGRLVHHLEGTRTVFYPGSLIRGVAQRVFLRFLVAFFYS